MRVNVYAEELTENVELISKAIDGREYVAVRFWLHLPTTLPDGTQAKGPFCGAEGRYILRFQVEDGRQLGAMRGCVKLFPASQVAHEHLRLAQKADRYAKQGWKLNRADSDAMDACERLFAREVSESYALGVIKSAKRANQMRGAYGGRR